MSPRPSESVAGPPPTTAPEKRPVGAEDVHRPRPQTLGSLLSRYLNVQHEVILRSELPLAPEAPVVDPTAGAVRRLQAGLQIFTPLLDSARAGQLQQELSWLGGLLSPVSDREELARWLRGQLPAPEDDDAWAVVAPQLRRILEQEKEAPLAELSAARRSDRYQQLMVLLAQWRTTVPLARKADRPPASVDKYLTRAVAEFDRQLTEGLLADHDDDLQPARRAARHVRYAAEVGYAVLGRRAAKGAKRVRRLEALVVEHTHRARTAALLVRVGPVPGPDGEQDAFTFGRLYEQELRRLTASRARLEQERG